MSYRYALYMLERRAYWLHNIQNTSSEDVVETWNEQRAFYTNTFKVDKIIEYELEFISTCKTCLHWFCEVHKQNAS